jgi:hypothetical protein
LNFAAKMKISLNPRLEKVVLAGRVQGDDVKAAQGLGDVIHGGRGHRGDVEGDVNCVVASPLVRPYLAIVA